MSSCNLKEEMGERLKTARSALGWTQKELCAAIGMPLPSLRDYELGKTIPGSIAVCGYAQIGINANWLLTGEGPMLLADLQAPATPAAPPGALDMARFQLAIEATEEGLAAARRTMQPNKKAELIMAVYDLLEEPGVKKDRVLKLVKLAA